MPERLRQGGEVPGLHMGTPRCPETQSRLLVEGWGAVADRKRGLRFRSEVVTSARTAGAGKFQSGARNGPAGVGLQEFRDRRRA